MSLYIHELLCVDSLGNVSVSHLTIQDDDANMASEEADAVLTLDGTVLTTPPVVRVGQLAMTLKSGAAWSATGMNFQANGNTYYLFSDETPADIVASAGVYTDYSVVGGIAYTGYGAIEGEILRPYQGLGFAISASGVNPPVNLGPGTFTVYDDDNKIETVSETGAGPQGHIGYHGQSGNFSNSAGDPPSGLGDTTLRLVEVHYSTDTGSGVFEGVEFTFIRYGSTYTVYIPRSGTADVLAITSIDSVSAAAGTLDGSRYSDFGLNFKTTLAEGTGADDLMRGNWVHDKFKGLGGADTLAGSLGEDQLYGGGGGDDLFGGMHADTLDGGKGGDALYGGAQNDNLIGGDGNDDQFGGWDDDTLDGGKGDDSLQGNEGNDALSGGNGLDTLVGGSGNDSLEGDGGDDDLRGGSGDDLLTDGGGSDTAEGGNGIDTFVFGTDGATDTISDFKNGTDLIDLAEAFAALTITDIAPGEVHVTHSGEVLIIKDTAGNLTAADLTAADFI